MYDLAVGGGRCLSKKKSSSLEYYFSLLFLKFFLFATPFGGAKKS
jgi:hypothetical protein